MNMLARIAAAAGALAIISAPTAGQTYRRVGVNEQTVKRAIDRCVKYLYSAANQQGIWDEPARPPGYKLDPTAKGYRLYSWGGKTALVLHALATAGQNNDPRFKKALGWLMQQKLLSNYAVSCRVQLIHQLPEDPKRRRVLIRDGNLLLRGARWLRNEVRWDYFPPPGGPPGRMGDFSNVNYAVLGLWAAEEERFEVRDRIWRGLERAYVSAQHANGAWSYQPPSPTTKSRPIMQAAGGMTTAGIASLYLVIDHLHARRGAPGSYRATPAYKAIQRGLEWMSANFSSTGNPGRPGFHNAYYFYNCERVAAAAGLKYFGTHDWFREIAANLLRSQAPDGRVRCGGHERNDGELTDTAFALLFLTKGSAPVIFNKLQHAGDWDNHVRELAALTGWLARQSERPANWQVVNLKVPVEDLTDSRILYIAGTEPLVFDEAERAKLKRYVELGGLLVFHPDSTSADGAGAASRPGERGKGNAFADSARKLLGEIWADLETRSVDPTVHALGTIYLPLTEKRIRLEELASPTRVFAFIVYNSPARAWERRLYATAKPMFALGANLHVFANDLAPLKKLPTKLTHFAEAFRGPTGRTTRTIKLARIKYSGNPHRWDPEPLAFERFSRLLAAREQVRCDIEVVTPEKLAGSGAKIAHLAGVGTAGLEGEQWDAIDAWLKAGGTLIVDQAGGPAKPRENTFDKFLRKLAAKRYGEGGMARIRSSHPLLKGLDNVSYRNVRGVRREKMPPVLEGIFLGGRPAVIYSRYDLTCGLLGAPNPLASGADSEGAYQILSHLLIKLAGQPKR